MVILFAPVKGMEYWLYGCAILFLGVLGATAANADGAKILKAIMRIVAWVTIAMALSDFVGYLFGVKA